MDRSVFFVLFCNWVARAFVYFCTINENNLSMRKHIFLAVLTVIGLSACHSHHEHSHEHEHEHEHVHEHHHDHDHDHEHEHDHDHAHEHEHEHESSHADEITISPAKAQQQGIQAQTIQLQPFQQVINASGQIEAAQGSEAVVVATASGVVSFQTAVTAGKAVQKGTALFAVSADELTDGDEARKAAVSFETAQSEYERATRLYQSQIISQKEYNRIKAEYEKARLAYAGIEKRLTAKGVNITAPISGFVKDCLVRTGDYVTVGQQLATVTQNQHLYLRVDVPARYQAQLSNISSANFRVISDGSFYELSQLQGRLVSYGKASGENPYFIPVVFEFNNVGTLFAGAVTEVFLLTHEVPQALVLPVSAITEEQGLYYVYTQLDEDCYHKQEVTLGATNGKEYQVLSGIQPGDNVVVKGSYQVKLASASNAIPAHSHHH